MRALASLRFVWMAVFLLLPVAFPARAGDVNIVGHFENGGVVAEIDTYKDGNVVVAVIALKANGATETFAFDVNDWPGLERLWETAKGLQGSTYQSAGTLAETGTTEKCVIAAAGGPTIRLTITSPVNGSIAFDIPGWMVTDFDSKLRQAASITTPS